MTAGPIGKPISRVDGRAKVTGSAKYAAEYPAANLRYGVVVSSTIARGRITRIDADEALQLEGVRRVFTHENLPKLAQSDSSYRDRVAPVGSPLRPLSSAEVRYSSQPVALVVADSLEQARYAASLVRVEYERAPHLTDLHAARATAYRPPPQWGFLTRLLIRLSGIHRMSAMERQRAGVLIPPLTRLVGFPPSPNARGDARAALAKAAVRVDEEYRLPVQHHNPLEPFATTAIWHPDETLTVYDKTQGVQNVQQYLCNVFGLAKDAVRVLSPFVGGGFGSGLRPQYQAFLAVLAARELRSAVRVVLTRQQMFSFGHRPATWQHLALGAAANGRLESILHEVISETSRFEDYSEPVVDWSSLLYRCDNVSLDHKIVPLDLHTPLDMRAPGATWGVHALECAMDELAARLGIDPVELRLRNYADRDQDQHKPFSSKELSACYQQGAERFGWARRNPEPRSMRDGDRLIGWGMATGVWDVDRVIASAKAVLTADGRLTVSSATADIGTGTYTIMTQLAAETLGLPLEAVSFELGDSSLPTAPIEGGSFTAATVGAAVQAVCRKVRTQLLKHARKLRDLPFARAGLEDLAIAEGQVRLRRDASVAVPVGEVLRRAHVAAITLKATTFPDLKGLRYSRHTHSAVFAEVKVDEALGTVQVSRVVSAVAAGRILNPKTARSQILGGVVWGISMALQEESLLDHGLGRFMNHTFAEYHIPVSADIHDIEVIFVEEHDEAIGPLGAKGVGEIGIVGVAAAIANAVFHATGKRVRELPITLDKLL